jgi:hypothetical protein
MFVYHLSEKYTFLGVLLIGRAADHFEMARSIDPKRFSRQLGLRIRHIRNEKGWTLEYCEERGWPNWTHLQRIEAGKPITIQTLVRIANLFGMHPADILKDV